MASIQTEPDLGSETSKQEEISAQGFLILRDFFTAEDLEPIWRDMDLLCQAFCDRAELPLEEVADRERDRRCVAIVRGHADLQPALYDRMQQLPSLLAVPNHPKIRSLAETLLETDRVGVWPRTQMRMDYCQDKANHIAWHTDHMYNQGTDDSFTFWMPLVDVSASMGLLQIAVGSHRVADQFHFIKKEGPNRFAFTLNDTDVQRLNIETPQSYRAGDLVVFHSKVIHCGAINTDPHRARLTTLFRMQNLNSLEVFDQLKS